MFRFVVLFCAVALVTGETTQDVQPCVNNAAPLPLAAKSQDFTLAINFATPYAVESMRTLAVAYLNFGGISFPVDLSLEENEVTCNFLTNGQCPTQPGQNLEHHSTLTESSSSPLRLFIEYILYLLEIYGMQAYIEFTIVDEQNNPLTCLRVPTKMAATDFGKFNYPA